MKELLEFKDVLHKIKEWKPETIRHLFFLLLCEKKVSFKELSESYVEALEVDNTDKLKRLCEAEMCVMENLQHTSKSKRAQLIKILFKGLCICSTSQIDFK